uniref:Uncharacterized protein n=1 Tax=Zea mays TaxID=4577 RepID=C4J7A1_MAIZE|nr:unknown [Zea mays]
MSSLVTAQVAMNISTTMELQSCCCYFCTTPLEQDISKNFFCCCWFHEENLNYTQFALRCIRSSPESPKDLRRRGSRRPAPSWRPSARRAWSRRNRRRPPASAGRRG